MSRPAVIGDVIPRGDALPCNTTQSAGSQQVGEDSQTQRGDVEMTPPPGMEDQRTDEASTTEGSSQEQDDNGLRRVRVRDNWEDEGARVGKKSQIHVPVNVTDRYLHSWTEALKGMRVDDSWAKLAQYRSRHLLAQYLKERT